MNTEYKFEIEDWMEFHKDYLETSKLYKLLVLILKWLVPLFFFLDVIKRIFSDEYEMIVLIVFTLILAGLSTLWVIFFPKKLFLKLILFIQRFTIKGGDNSTLLGLHKLTVNDDHIHLIQPESESKFNWNAVKRLRETEAYYFLYLTTVSAIVIPKKKITADLNELDLILKKHIQVV